MTYESAFQWVIDNMDVSEYDNYDDYYSDIEEKMQTSTLTDNPEFQNMVGEYWERNGNDLIEVGSSRDIEYTPTPKGIQIEQGAVITNEGIKPVEVVQADVPQTPVSENIIIEKQGSTAQRKGLIESIKSAFSSFARRFKR